LAVDTGRQLNAKQFQREDIRGGEAVTYIGSVTTAVQELEPAASKRRKFPCFEANSVIEPQIAASLVILKDSRQLVNIQVLASLPRHVSSLSAAAASSQHVASHDMRT
jgi:hypothetical protein